MSAGSDFRAHVIESTLPQIVDQIVAEANGVQEQVERIEWQASEPLDAFPQHQDLHGLQYTKETRNQALDKKGWATRAIFGEIDTFVELIWTASNSPEGPDHDGCQCRETELTVTERLRVTAAFVTGDKGRVRVQIDGPRPDTIGGVPVAIQAAQTSLIKNELDEQLADGSLFRRILSRVRF